jgi:hypothetical protein
MKSRGLALSILVAVATATAPLAASAAGFPWNGSQNGTWTNNGNVRQTGVVASTQGSSLTLQNGETIFLHQGTVINPTGTTLQPGMQIQVIGGYGGNNAVNASEIDVVGNAYNGAAPYGYGNPYQYGAPAPVYNNGYNNGYSNAQARREHEEWLRQQELQRQQAARARAQWEREHRAAAAQQQPYWQNRSNAQSNVQSNNGRWQQNNARDHQDQDRNGH